MVKALILNACCIWKVGVRALKGWRTDVGKMIFPCGRGKSKVLAMETVRWRGWYSAQLQPCGANLSFGSRANPEREREQLFQRMFRKGNLTGALEKPFYLLPGEKVWILRRPTPKVKVNFLSSPRSQRDAVGWGDHDLKILRNWHNRSRVLRSEYLPCNK